MELVHTTEGNALPDKLEAGFVDMGMKYADHDGKFIFFTFENFFKAMKDNNFMNKLILKISDV